MTPTIKGHQGTTPEFPVGIPPFRFDSDAASMLTLAEHDWGLIERDLPDEWKEGAGEGVIVFVLDTGVPEHKDLPTPKAEMNFTNSRTKYDRQGHHSHCAGIVHQWAPKADLAHFKVLGDNGSGATTWITAAINRVTELWEGGLKNEYKGCVISLSLGGPNDRDQDAACKRAEAAGICLCAAAGNSGANAGVDSPGDSKATLGTASYRRDGNISTFSSGGPEVDFGMPGEQILSTYLNNQYRVLSGTSMATPALAGLVACAISSRPDDDWIKNTEGMRNLLMENAEDRGNPGKDNRFGYGVPNAPEAIRNPEWWYF